MSVFFTREIEKLKRRILHLGGLVEDCLAKSIASIVERNASLAQDVIEGDDVIDHEEVDIEEICLKTLALYQPVAIDLRFVVSVLKINSDLERIADLAVNISKRALLIIQEPNARVIDQIPTMATKCRGMLRSALDAMVRGDVVLAREVLELDKQVDMLNREVYDLMKTRLENGSDSVAGDIHILTIARFIERAADHATNIAEDVIYLQEGRIVRHTPEVKRAPRT